MGVGLFKWMAVTYLIIVSMAPVCTEEKQNVKFGADYNGSQAPLSKDVPSNVTILLNVTKASISEENEEITLHGFVVMQWQETRLNTTIGEAILDGNQIQQIWKPHIAIYPSREPEVYDQSYLALVVLYENGTLYYKGNMKLHLFCAMDFSMYPMDVHNCTWSLLLHFVSSKEMNLIWNDDGIAGEESTLKSLYPFRVQLNTSYTDMLEQGVSFRTLTLTAHLRREFTRHLLVTYMPGHLLVIISWGSFLVKPEVVPGRMVLLVTNLLSLLTMFSSVRNTSPGSTRIKPVEVWLVACIFFVSLAMVEYAVLLLYTRFEKAWQESLWRPLPDKHGDDAADTESSDLRNRRKSRLKLLSRKCGGRLGRFLRLLHAKDAPGCIDLSSLIIFPICFIIFSAVYWSSYLR